jgi:hypothetical protein
MPNREPVSFSVPEAQPFVDLAAEREATRQCCCRATYGSCGLAVLAYFFVLPLFSSNSMPIACNPTKADINQSDIVEVYFGCGCFWHVQHEFVTLEMSDFCRSEDGLTARAAYAGGTRVGDGSLVCYHNMQGKAYYGSMGHAEVVSLTVPVEKFGLAAKRFWEVCPKGDRRDRGDAGLEYRAAIGLPGGMSSPLLPHLRGLPGSVEMVAGDGSEGDNIGTSRVHVYDTSCFPATVAEKYHQFHDDMVEAYGGTYHELRKYAQTTGCPGDSGWNPIR